MSRENQDQALRGLLGTGSACLLLYVAVLQVSPAFAYEQHQLTRPVRLVLSLFALAFVLYLSAIWFGLRLRSKYLTTLIVGFAIAFRAVLLFSEPIQEVDIYRYVWDGIATTNGVDPFEFSPQEVLQADANGTSSPSLQRLVAARDSSTAVRVVLDRVHFGELPTVYPPVSQAVFAAATWSTPADASVGTRLVTMKAWVLVFDLATVVVIALTLNRSGLNAAWLIAYAWCPLVMKEFANSGHLDSIAIFLSSLAIYFASLAFFPAREAPPHAADQEKCDLKCALLGSVCLALAVGAKLYPIALVPIASVMAWRNFGWARTVIIACVFTAVTGLCLVPMFGTSRRELATSQVENPFAPNVAEGGPADAVPPEPDYSPRGRGAGLKAFLSHWMMNDFIFLNISENVTPDGLRLPGAARPWFVFVPDGIRQATVDLVCSMLPIEAERVPFVLARTLTAIAFMVLAVFWAWSSSGCKEPGEWLQFVFLTMAWFWLLLPTLNPWYWIWALPWIPYAKNRVWLGMSGLLFIYYTRFYFGAAFEDERVITPMPYAGEEFFDFVVVWVEYVPWFIALCIWYWNAHGRKFKSPEKSDSSLPSSSS